MPTLQTDADPLHQQITFAISTCPYLSQPNLSVDAQQGRVTLRGQVASYYQKQMAQEALRRVDGIEQIENLLQVNWS